jgi:hypothetical protein
MTKIRNTLLSIGFLFSFVWIFPVFSYLVTLLKPNIKIRLREIVFFIVFLWLGVSLAFVVKNDYSDFVNAIRFYYGFIIFYYIFQNINIFPLVQIFWLLVFLLIIEALAINTFVNARDLPNFPDEGTHFTSKGYQRPYSFGRNASVSSTIFIVLAALKFKISIRGVVISFITTCIFASGVGFVSFILYLCFYLRSLFNRLTMIIILCAIASLAWMFIVSNIFRKISLDYFIVLIELKTYQSIHIINNVLDGDLTNLILGSWWQNKLDINQGGDFGYLLLVENFGILGLFLFFWFVLVNTNRNNYIGVIIILVSSLHYPTFGFFSGQMLLGYVLSVDKNIFSKKNKSVSLAKLVNCAVR